MPKDNPVPEEVKLTQSSNFHLWKYLITRMAKWDKLCDIQSNPTVSTFTKGNRPNTKDFDAEKSSEDRLERLMYILIMFIRPSLLSLLINYQNPKELGDFLHILFENAHDNRKFDLKNRLSLIVFSDGLGIENYFFQFRHILVELSASGTLEIYYMPHKTNIQLLRTSHSLWIWKKCLLAS